MGRELNLDNPETFNEKIQWLKLYDRKPKYTIMVDKIRVKEYVADIIGKEHIIPTLEIWDTVESIDISHLPTQFVLKCSHDSGGLSICRDKNNYDLTSAKKILKASFNRDYYSNHREWPYKDVPKKIFAEKYMYNAGKDGLVDYKFYCFDGEPKFLYVSEGLENHPTARISFLELDWSFAPYERSDFKTFQYLPKKPSRFDEMIQIARILSKDIPFLRVDLYEINGFVYFSELTFSPCAGYMPFKDYSFDYEIGQLLHLPRK